MKGDKDDAKDSNAWKDEFKTEIRRRDPQTSYLDSTRVKRMRFLRSSKTIWVSQNLNDRNRKRDVT